MKTSPTTDSIDTPNDTVVITANRGFLLRDVVELWRWRELFATLIVRDIVVRYKQTAIGIGWVIIQPLVTVAIFSFLLGKMAKVPTEGLPYPLFAFAAMVPWQIFSKALTEGSLSLISNQAFVSKVYFPRVLLPSSVVFAHTVDFIVTFAILFVLMLWYGVSLSWTILLTPLIFLLTLLTSLGVVLFLSALNVLYRDVRVGLPFLAQVWLFLTPVLYPTSIIPEKWQVLYALNPMVAVTEAFRWAVLGTAPSSTPLLFAISLATLMVLLITGLMYFYHIEQQMADRI